MPLHYQWFKNSKAIGERIIIPLYNGDIYIMSEKATGCDWRKRSKLTLRHATGASKYTTIKEKVKSLSDVMNAMKSQRIQINAENVIQQN